MTVTGAGLGGAGSHVLCRFGEELINASRVDESTLRCFAPAAPASAPAGDLGRPLAITLNGQQFTEAADDGAFIQYEPPQISTLYPVSGPATGGETTITVRGNGFGFGRADDSETRRRCAFDGTDTGAATRIETGAGAALRASPPALRSDAPPLGEGVPLTVSLNGQQFSASSGFLAFAPHNLTLTAPASGPFAGGTLVNVSLDGAAHNATDGALCRFGDGAEVAATQPSVGGDSVLCVAPAAAAAGATPEWHEGFEAGCPTARSRSAPRASTAASCSSRRSRAAARGRGRRRCRTGGLGDLDHDGSASAPPRAARGSRSARRPSTRAASARPGSLR